MNIETEYSQKTREELKGRAVLVTGADGFIGSHLTDALTALGADVSVLVHRNIDQLKRIGHLADRVRFCRADVQNYTEVFEVINRLPKKSEAVIFHLAAHTHVGDSWEHPEETLKTNVLGTLNLQWAIRESNLELHKFCYTGSSEEYGSYDSLKAAGHRHVQSDRIFLDETASLNPKSIYATSKVAADFLSRNFFDAYGTPSVVVRMFNIFGPLQNPRFITGTVITQALCRDLVEIGSPYGKRDFSYVDDGVRGLLRSTLFGEPGGLYVLGKGENISIGDWPKLILEIGRENKIWGERRLVTREDRFRPGRTDEAELLADSTRLKEICGWESEVSWEEGILKTIHWYAENRSFWETQVDWQ